MIEYFKAIKEKLKNFIIPFNENNKISQSINHNKDKREKSPFLIWGTNNFSQFLYHLLDKDSDANVISFIDASNNGMFCGKPVYSPEELKNNNLSHIPIIVTVPHVISGNDIQVDFESIYQFKLKIQEIIHKYDIENYLLHPSALIDFVSVEYPNKIIQFGLQGSGITFLSHICTNIIGETCGHFTTKHENAKFFEKMCFEYAQCIQQIIADAVHLNDGFNFHMVSWKIATSFAIYFSKNVKMLIHSFPTRNHIIGPVYSYHQIPTQQYIRRLQDQKFKLFFNMRDPLDIILSNIKKRSGIDKDSQKLDMKTFCKVSKWMIAQLNFWDSIPSGFEKFSYENIIENPIYEIQRIMNILNVEPSLEIAKKIWKDLSFKQLPTAPKNHFKGGGVGNWEKYFKSEHISFLKEFGIEEILEKYAYFDTLKKFKNYSETIYQYNWKKHCSDELLDEITQPVKILKNEDYDTGNHLKSIHDEANFSTGDYFYIAGGDSVGLIKMKKTLENQYIKTITLAGMHPELRFV